MSKNATAKCPTLLISSIASGQGKTTVTAALAWHFRQQGLKVRVFKTGPDFLDPKILEVASSHPVYQLDLWMTGEEQCREQLYAAATRADLILIEGVMGLFDGSPSSAELAKFFNIPVVAVIDASAMAGTFAAIAHGLKYYDKELKFHGVLANRIGGESHAQMLRESLPQKITWFGALSRNNEIHLNERHLGLLPANEIKALPDKLNLAAEMLAKTGLGKFSTIPMTEFHGVEKKENETPLNNIRIGIAQDEAFCFCYQANLDLLLSLGAKLIFFSPIHDTQLPEIDSLYLPGGYPELHLEKLQNNVKMKSDIQQHFNSEKTILAECGGLLYLTDTIYDINEKHGNMLGIISGEAKLQKRLVNISMQSMSIKEGTIRGHSYHHSKLDTTISVNSMTSPNGKFGSPEAVYRIKNLIASYMHLYMPSNPKAITKLFLR